MIPGTPCLESTPRISKAGPAIAGSLIAALCFAKIANAQDVKSPDVGTFQEFLQQHSSDPLFNQNMNILEPRSTLTPPRIPVNTPALLPPASPFPHPMESLPEDDPRTAQYERDIQHFLLRRQDLRLLATQYNALISERSRASAGSLSVSETRSNYFASKVLSWNGSIFWAPASKSSDINLQFADEVRSVFGPIPPFDVTTLGKQTRADGYVQDTATSYAEVDGNRVELKPNLSKPGTPLEFEVKAQDGNVSGWLTTVERCDKPSLAGGVTPCGTASRVSHAIKGNIEWIALARKTMSVAKLDPIPYWMNDNPSYALLGYIGFNRVTGELAFFDSSYNGIRFDWKSATVPPGGKGYEDDEGRAIAASTYDSTFRVDCAACHDNRTARIITPYIKQARVGYRDPNEAMAFSMGTLIPEVRRGSRAPYRVVGSSYNAVHADTISSARSIMDPTKNCTSCHGLTNNGTARFASDAVGKLGSITDDSAIENSYRTDWALRSGNGKIHPWMIPDDGNDLSAEPPAPALSDSDWDKLRGVLETPPNDALHVYTTAPAPESAATDASRIADPAGPTNFVIAVADNRDGPGEQLPKEVHLSWNYLNNLGGVPERDDVRFNVAVKETDIPTSGSQPDAADFPSIEQTKGTSSTVINDAVYSDGQIFIMKDVSFAGHRRWSDPAPSSTPRQYRMDFPASSGKRYLLRIVAKRFAFDQTGELFSTMDHVFSVDVH